MCVKLGLSHYGEEHRLRVYENGVLKRIFGPQREVVFGGWRRLHNEELHKMYSSSNITRMMTRGGRDKWFI
jgi:hypothetical protein